MADFSTPGEIIDAFATALNAKDADHVGAAFSEEAKFVNVRGVVMHGRKGIVDGHAAAFLGPLAGSTFTFDAIEELNVTPDTTVLLAHSVRDREPGAPSTTGPFLESILQLVARRGPTGWLAVSAANVPVAPPPGSPTT